jgi:pyruvate dehydrogenase E1 component beta subunit
MSAQIQGFGPTADQERRIPMTRAIREALQFEMDRDESVFYMGEDIAAFGSLYQTATGFFERYGAERVRDTPISEAGFIAAATGAAVCGMKPVVELMFVDFVGVCLDPIYNLAAKNAYHSNARQPVPMVILTGIGGGYSDGTQHSQTLYATLGHLPGLKVVVPSNSYDAKGLMHAAVRDPNPVVYMLHKRLTGISWFGPIAEAANHVPEGDYVVPIGQAAVVRPGTDVTLVGLGETVWHCIFAAEALEREGISAEVVDLRTVAPLDRATLIDSAGRTGRLVVADEDYRSCGVAAEVIASVVESGAVTLRAPPKRVTFPDIPVPYSPPLELFARPNAEKVAATARALFR